MATAKLLQKPQILEIIGSTIRVGNPDISGYTRTYLAAQILASGTAMSVHDNNRFADDDWFIVGEVGDSETEENDVNGAVTRGKSITVTNTLKFDHELDAPVTRIFERGIKIYGAATDGGAGTLIASIDALTMPLADATMIQWNKKYTEYTLISTDTTYAFYYVKFTDGTTDSSASDYIASTGLTSSSVEYFIQQALRLTNSTINEDVRREDLVKWANDCQSAITQYAYQDPRSMELTQIDWDFEVTEDKTSIALTENENRYSLSSLSTASKYPNSDRSIVTVRIGDRLPLKKITIDEYDDIMAFKRRTDVATEATAGQTTLTVDSNVEFDASGSLYVGGDLITYTAKSGTTGFTGIPASGAGSITETHAVDSPVWQNIAPGLPKRYVIFEGNIYLDQPVDEDYENYILKVRYYKNLGDLTEASDTTSVNFTNVFQWYLASMIENRKGNIDKAELYMKKFDGMVLDNALKSAVPTQDEQTYFQYDDYLDPYSKNLDYPNRIF